MTSSTTLLPPPTVSDPSVRPAGQPPRGAFRMTFGGWLAVLIAAGGVTLRLVHWAAFRGCGFDETLYAHYLGQMIKVGLTGYPDIVDAYLALQTKLPGSILPPTRFLYIFCAYCWHHVFGGDALTCFYAVSRLFSVLTLGVAGLFARRLLAFDRRLALGAFALMAFSPLQIHMAQHALADGFFEFFVLGTLWALWECLRQPGHRGWLAAYAVGLALMVTTKENAFFVFVAILALLAANVWLRFGTTTRALLVLTVLGPLAGVAVLVNLSGGVRPLLDVYLLGVPKNLKLGYAIATGDGPWHRYLLDLLTVSPLVLILGVGMAFQLRAGREHDRPYLFGLVFIAASYALMCNVKYGMNLRYATMWDLPLRLLAVGQLELLAARWGRWQTVAFAAAIFCLCGYDLYQYERLAVAYPLYELAPVDLLHALQVLK